jgi:hypothetical protein
MEPVVAFGIVAFIAFCAGLSLSNRSTKQDTPVDNEQKASTQQSQNDKITAKRYLEKYTNFTPKEIDYFIFTSPDNTKNIDTALHFFNGNIGKHIIAKTDTLLDELAERSVIFKKKKIDDLELKIKHLESELKTEVKKSEQYYKTLGLRTNKLSALEAHASSLELERAELLKCIDEKDKLYESLKKDPNNIVKNAAIFNDFIIMQYETTIKILETKKYPAVSTADKLREFRIKTNEILKEYKELQYKLADFLNTHPIFEDYFSNEEESDEDNTLKEIENIDDDEERIKKLISAEEYKNLDEDTRNQRALDNYISKRKSKWSIGRDYEMFIGHEYTVNGFAVSYHGILKGYEDFGRDLIAVKDDRIEIIQCKYWSRKKVIHEKHICQLYGSVIEYKLENNCDGKEIVPVFITSTILSDTAKKFADYLNVRYIENKELGVFPRIKCNIGSNGKKIYHLPMDQQYNRVIIDKKEEFYAHAVKEATENGFRRAWKWHGNNQSS